MDGVYLAAGGNMYGMSEPSALQLGSYWQTAEFNIFGAGGGSQAVFNPGSTIVVQTLIDSATPTSTPPRCSFDVQTGEGNNLTVLNGFSGTVDSCYPIGGCFPGIQFMESKCCAPCTLLAARVLSMISSITPRYRARSLGS
jgi:hypothetical protein